MTRSQARRLYEAAGANWSEHSESELAEIVSEMEAIVAAKSDRAAGRVIDWWGCWDRGLTATRFARRVREEWRKMMSEEATP